MKKNIPAVSVVIPVYNTELYLEQCINSIRDQSLKDLEILCVDDGSTDDSPEILKRLAAQDERITILTQQNRYAGRARNFGMAHASGEYIIFLDSDDFFDPDMLSVMYDACRADDADICVCSGQVYEEDTHRLVPQAHYLKQGSLPDKRPFSVEDIPDKIFNFTVCAPWNKLFRRAFLEENALTFQETRNANDLYFGNISLALARRITICGERFVNYRKGETGSLQEGKDSSPLDFYRAMLYLQSRLREEGLWQKTEKSFANYCLSGALYNLDTMKTGEGYSLVYRTLRNEGFEKLNISGHSRSYFYVKSFYDRMLDILEKEPEIALYDRMKDAERQTAQLCSGRLLDEHPCFEALGSLEEQTEPAVSVIIPVYNVEGYLAECLGSVISQTLGKIEIICVDDGSTDRSPEILEQYSRQDDRIRVIRQENAGQSAARNKGLAAAGGAYILFLDSDDYLDPDALRQLTAYAKFHKLDQLFYGASVFFESKQVEEENQNYLTYYRRCGAYPDTMTGREAFIRLRRNGEFLVSPCLQLLRRDFLTGNALSFYEGIIQEDELFTMQCTVFSARTRVLNTGFYHRRVRAGSTMTGEGMFRHSYGYFVCVRETQVFIREKGLWNYSTFYRELTEWLYERCDLAARQVQNLSDDDLAEYVLSLPPEEGLSYLMLVNHWRYSLQAAKKRIDVEKKVETNDLKKRLRMSQRSLDACGRTLENERKKLQEVGEERDALKESLQKSRKRNKELKEKVNTLKKEAQDQQMQMKKYEEELAACRKSSEERKTRRWFSSE